MPTPIFKEYDPNQATFLPPSLDELLAPTHMVRFVNHVIDHMDLQPILSSYKGGGTSSYHPRMMLKILIYGYVERIHSCRAIARAVREQIPFMWLAGGQYPDFRNINHFRQHRLPGEASKPYSPRQSYPNTKNSSRFWVIAAVTQRPTRMPRSCA